MKRRDFVTIGGMLLARSALAETGANTPRVALFSGGPALSGTSGQGAAFVRGMMGQGYALGRNFALEARGASGRGELLPRLAQELVDLKVGAIVTIGFPPTLAAKATGLPVVGAAGIGDPVATSLVESLAHPGGNVTGISDPINELSGKRLALLNEISPSLRRVAMLWNKDDPAMTLRYKASADVAMQLGITVKPLGVGEPNDFGNAFSDMERDMPDAILMVTDILTNLNRQRVIDFALKYRLPAIYESQAFVRDGALMSYAGDLNETFARAAALVSRILQGAKPADLPFEQPTRYNLAINLKTAAAIGLSVPPLLVARADEVIE